MRGIVRTRTATLATLSIAVLLLSGCGTGTAESPSQTPTPTGEDTPTSSPSPTTAEPDLDDPSTWTVTAEGAGPVMIGGDFDATLAELPDTWTGDGAACSWVAFWNADDAGFSMFFARGTESDTEPISEISASTAADSVDGQVGPVTEEDLGIGASRDEILAAHPDAVEGTGSVDGEWIRIPSDGEAQVFFQFLADADAAWAVTVTTRDEPSYEVCG